MPDAREGWMSGYGARVCYTIWTHLTDFGKYILIAYHLGIANYDYQTIVAVVYPVVALPVSFFLVPAWRFLQMKILDDVPSPRTTGDIIGNGIPGKLQ